MLSLKKIMVNLLLAAVASGLGVAFYQSWSKELPPLPAPASLKKKESRKSPPDYKRIIPSKSSFRAVTDRNLFSPERKEYIPVKQVTEDTLEIKKAPKVSGRAIKLFGIIQVGDKKSALINDPLQKGKDRKKNKWVTVGDRIGNLRVIEISADRLQLRDGKDRYEILLHDENKEKHGSSPAAKAEPTVISTGTSSTRTAPGMQPKDRQPAAEDVIIVHTPFGPLQRRKK